MNTIYAIDFSLKPTTFDLWHVCLAGAVALLLLILMVLLISRARCRKKSAIQQAVQIPEPVVKVVEKIVEVEKIVHAPAPEPLVLKEATPHAAL